MSSKFRVYDKQEKKYVDLKNNPLWMDNEGDFYFISDLPCCSCEGMSFYSDRYVVEFSTGLKDKNGVELFEGDMVRWTNCKHYWEAVISKVKNNKTNTLYAIETFHNCTSNDEGYFTYIRTNSRAGIRNELEYIGKFEIIGNIHDGEADDKI